MYLSMEMSNPLHELARSKRNSSFVVPSLFTPLRISVDYLGLGTMEIFAVASALLFSGATIALDRNLDQFNYVATVTDDIHNSFGPEDWGSVTCPNFDNCVRISCYLVFVVDKA